MPDGQSDLDTVVHTKMKETIADPFKNGARRRRSKKKMMRKKANLAKNGAKRRRSKKKMMRKRVKKNKTMAKNKTGSKQNKKTKNENKKKNRIVKKGEQKLEQTAWNSCACVTNLWKYRDVMVRLNNYEKQFKRINKFKTLGGM